MATASTAEPSAARAAAAWHLVCSLEQLLSAQRELFRTPAGRGILLVKDGSNIYALDHACYHHGGPLADSDIEDLGGHRTIVCPWHRYKISIQTGECLYVGLDMATRQQQVKSKGVKQRTHPVRLVDASMQCRSGAPELLREAGIDTSTGLPLPAPGTAPGAYVLDMCTVSSIEEASALGPDVLLHWGLCSGGRSVESDGYACLPFNRGQAQEPPSGHALRLHSSMPR